MILNKWFKKKNKATGAFFSIVKTVAYDAEVLLALEPHLDHIKALTSSPKAVNIQLIKTGANSGFRLMSSVFQLTNERFTGIHKLAGKSPEGKAIVSANSGINLGEQEFRALIRHFPLLKGMIFGNSTRSL